MRTVAPEELQCWLHQAKILEKDSRGIKVAHMSDGRFLKLFYVRNSLLLARLRPPAMRFRRNALALQKRSVITPQVLECVWVGNSPAVSACIYQPLDGISLDKIYRDARADFDDLLPQLARYILFLHECGIYFRSLRLGNILLIPGNTFGLIDILDLRLKRQPLGHRLVQRNFNHFRNYLQRNNMPDFHWDALLNYYEAAKKNRTENGSKHAA